MNEAPGTITKTNKLKVRFDGDPQFHPNNKRVGTSPALKLQVANAIMMKILVVLLHKSSILYNF